MNYPAADSANFELHGMNLSVFPDLIGNPELSELFWIPDQVSGEDSESGMTTRQLHDQRETSRRGVSTP
jgi:hypothetical protein